MLPPLQRNFFFQEAERQAEKLGLERDRLHALLALGRMEMKAGNRARVQALQGEARARGFVRIAAKAARAVE